MVIIMRNRFWFILGMYSLCLFMTLNYAPTSKAAETVNVPESAPAPKATTESVLNLLKAGDEQEKKGDLELSLDTNKSAIEQSTSIGDRKT